jgi:hypothetical protein
VRVAEGPTAFASAIRQALDQHYDADKARSSVASEGWDAKAGYLLENLIEIAREVGSERSAAVEARRTAA